MVSKFIDLTDLCTSDESDEGPPAQRSQKRQGSYSASHSGLRIQGPISPPALSRQALSNAQGRENVPMASNLPQAKSNPHSEQKVKEEATLASTNFHPGIAVRESHGVASAESFGNPYGTPAQQTPRKIDWTVEKIEVALRNFSHDIGHDAAKVTTRLLQSTWKTMAPTPLTYSKKNWFVGMKRTPVEAGNGALKLKVKHMGPGRTGKQAIRDYYEVKGIKTDKEPVPKYDFHHIEIRKNILSPNTILNFVPHLRDLADEEESKYRRWLENLENMDKTSGFATLSRKEKVHKTCQKERALTLLLYLDSWLKKLSIQNCSKTTLIRYMASQTDAVTPQQMSSILSSYNNDNDSPWSAKTVKIFTEAFDRVFDNSDIWKEGAVTLRDVLLLDKSIDTIVDSKKWIKDTPNQVKPIEENTTLETFLETYSLLGCLICFSHSCEHGEYGTDNERKRFSIDVVGGLKPLVCKKAMQASKVNSSRSQSSSNDPWEYEDSRKPCSDECFLRVRPNTPVKSWSETEIMLLKTAVFFFCDQDEPIQCSTAVATGRPCWDVDRQFHRLGLQLPQQPLRSQEPDEVKSVHWYDRFKKVLHADWQEQTITHAHQLKDHFDPCSHDGPCTKDNCECARNGLMCERFCRCTVDTCAIKFTGCACHSQGRTCLPRQKGEKPCICIQLNRECDPALCGSCGATDRANPKNAEDDQLFKHGCQNCALQRGKSKSLLLGKSTIEGCGYGLFTAENIAQDDFVIEYVGELITQDEGVRREARRGDVFDEEHNSSYLFTLLEQEGIWVDAAIYGNLSRYINHQDDFGKGQGCNITPKIMYVGSEYRIKFSALRDINAGEELFFNYGSEFPNLTKKLLEEQEEQTAVETNAKKQGKARKGWDEEEVVDNTKKPKGKKRGRKPKKKSFAARLESDQEAEDGNEALSDEDLGPRKRKPKLEGSESGREKYRKRNIKSNLRSGTGRSRFYGRQGLGRNNPAQQGDDVDMPDAETPRSQGKRSKKMAEDDEDEDEIDENLDAEYNGGGLGNGAGHRGGDTIHRRAVVEETEDSAAEEDTPSRVRTRKRGHDIRDLNPSLTREDLAFDQMGHDRLKSEATAKLPVAQKKKRGRPRKVQPVDEIAETDDNADENSTGATSMDNKLSQSIINDSDASSNAGGNRNRVRKRPARYDE
ncbi:hypothetical protein BKA67DRAFT_656028 [Truncatella angustata]|uniref:Uncharacterized protein n=1 Tax=Truncatella angustata TaxID=152316 RepID=A0A9P9A241_9PEZI|nr:uncharacterized protein BKA67DRAFT_656028 [Truncatella angustata]KAH6657786.1 hypothetical protein BKA67DRAFT_656028 [Truncatella angustata]